MGSILSTSNLAPPFPKITEWNWSKLLNAIHNYRNDEHDFVLDKGAIGRLTSLDHNDVHNLISSLPTDQIGNVNALAFLITLIITSSQSADVPNPPSIRERLVTTFNLFDFECKGKIHADELTILLMMVFTACNAIFGKQEEYPPISNFSKLTANAFETAGKRSNNMLITKEEFVQWCLEMFEMLSNSDYEEIAKILREGGPLVPSKSKRDKRKPKSSESNRITSAIKANRSDEIFILKRFLSSRVLEFSTLNLFSNENSDFNLNSDSIRTYTLGIEDYYDNYAFLLAENKDLFMIKKSKTISQKTEITIYSAESNYQEILLSIPTALQETNTSFVYLLGMNRDLIVVIKQGTVSLCTEVYILTAESNYQEFSMQVVSTLPETDISYIFLRCINTNDIFVIKKPIEESVLHIYILMDETNFSVISEEYISMELTNYDNDNYDYFYMIDSLQNIIIIKNSKYLNPDVTHPVEMILLAAETKYQTQLQLLNGEITFQNQIDVLAQAIFLNSHGGQCEFHISEQFQQVADEAYAYDSTGSDIAAGYEEAALDEASNAYGESDQEYYSSNDGDFAPAEGEEEGIYEKSTNVGEGKESDGNGGGDGEDDGAGERGEEKGKSLRDANNKAAALDALRSDSRDGNGKKTGDSEGEGDPGKGANTVGDGQSQKPSVAPNDGEESDHYYDDDTYESEEGDKFDEDDDGEEEEDGDDDGAEGEGGAGDRKGKNKKKKSSLSSPKRHDFKTALLHISKLEAKNLKHVEAFGGKNDPYCLVSFFYRDGWLAKTKTHWEGGNDVHWDLSRTDLQWTVRVTKEDLLNDKLEIRVIDDNTILIDKEIGHGEVSLKSLADIGPSKETHFLHMHLVTDEGVSAGNITVGVRLLVDDGVKKHSA